MRRLRRDCIKCLTDRHLTNFPDDASEEKQIEYMQKVLNILASAEEEESAPEIARDIAAARAEMFGEYNQYEEIKKYFNKEMMKYETNLRDNIKNSSNPLKLVVQYAMAGNYIDFGAMKEVDEKELNSLLDTASQISVDPTEYGKFVKDLEKAKTLLIITDNCGEIVMDKLLAETIKELYPNIAITFMVRGVEVLNDVTLVDAKQIGLIDEFTVINNGTDIGGTCINEMSGNPLQVLNNSDVIVAKGQGNFETMRGCNLNVYYLFLCKCQMFADDFGVKKLTGMFVNDKTWLESQN